MDAGLELLRWLPADLTTMLPRLFRAAPVAPVQIEGTVDDDVAAGDGARQPPEVPGVAPSACRRLTRTR
ncbi:MAG: hypothetical protein R3F43_15865 [bacterium]